MNRSLPDIQARKRQLILEGQLYRLDAARAKALIRDGLSAKALTQDAIEHAAQMATLAGSRLGLNLATAKALLPMGLAGLSAWRRFKSWRSKR